MQICKNPNIYCQIWLLSKNCAKKKRELQQIIHFWKAFDPPNLNVQKHLQKFENLNLNSRKTENVQILFKGVIAPICATFLCKNCAICKLFIGYKIMKSNDWK